MNIAMWPNPSGSRFWRLEDPAKYLQRKGIDARIITTGITEDIAKWADIYVLQGTVDKEGIALLYTYQQEFGKKIVVDQDDLPEIEDDNPHKKEHEATNALEITKILLEIADMVTTTTEYLADRLRKYNKNVVVLPNSLDLERWDIPKLTNNSKREIRIGWAGSITHLKDLESIVKPLTRLLKENNKVKLVLCGDPRLKDLFPGLNVECMLGVPFEFWPSKLSGLRLDIGLAPLRNSEFNKCKSPIKFYEYSIMKIPGVYSPTVYNFRGFDNKFGMICYSQNQWYHCLKNMIEYPILRQDIVSNAYPYVKTRKGLKKNINLWVKAYKSLTSSKNSSIQ